jgi:PPOX class probable F420-dependent enzyme
MTDVAHRVGDAPTKSLTTAERAFLEQPYVGIVTDLRPDGTPHSTVVWVDVDDGGVSINTAWPRAKPRYLQADPRIALLVVDPGDAYRWVSISGTATLTEEGANEQIDRLAKKYRGLDSYPWHKPEETRVSVRISPTWIESRGLTG